MDIEFSQEDLAFQVKVQDFIKQNLPKGMDMWTKRAEWFQAMRDQGGWDIAKWPVEFGGPGFTPTQRYIFDMEMARNSTPPQIPFGVGMLAPILMNYGTKAQQDRFLPGIRDGSVNWCQGYSEPNAGSDLASLRTSAVSDGDDFIVNGQKTWTTLAQDASHMFLLVRTSTEGRKQSGISFLLVDFQTPCNTVRPIKNLAGDEEFCEVFFDNVRVPKQNIVGELNAGWSIAKALLSFERLFIGSPKYSQYTLQRLDEVIAERGLQRDQGFMDRCTKIRADILDLETTFMKFAEIVRSGGTLGPDTSLLKIWASETFSRMTELLIEASGEHGAELGNIEFGRVKTNTMAQFYNARPTTIYGGSNEVQRNILAKHVLGLP